MRTNHTPVHPDLEKSIDSVRSLLAPAWDAVYRKLRLGTGKAASPCALVYMRTLVDPRTINDSIMGAVLAAAGTYPSDPAARLRHLRDQVLNVGQVTEVDDLQQAAAKVVAGFTLLLVDGADTALLCESRRYAGRKVTEPESEGAIIGPRSGFVEDIQTNLALLRQVHCTPDLKTEMGIVGRTSRTPYSLVWLEGRSSPGVLEEVRRRLSRIRTDAILTSTSVAEFIRDHPYTPFPLIRVTERTDVVCAALAEGKVAVVVAGSPHVLVAPALLVEFFQAADDYSIPYLMGTLVRLVRLLGFFLTLLLPALYVALSSYHQEILPTKLLLRMAASREGAPFPAFAETLMMIITFEVLREAGARIPRAVGAAVTIVGALVIGDSAVRAGLISAPMVVVVALTALAGFVSPTYNFTLTVRLLSLPMLLLASTLGFVGLAFGGLGMLVHLATLRSLGVPYLTPLAPLARSGLGDTLFRLPAWSRTRYPEQLVSGNRERVQPGLKPGPRHGGDADNA